MNSKVLAWAFAACFLLGRLAVAWSHRSHREAVVAAGAHSSPPLRPRFPQGGYSIVLQHTGEALRKDDQFDLSEAAFNVVGIAVQAKLGLKARHSRPRRVSEPWLYDQARPEPPETLDILAKDGLVWRVQLRVVVDGRDESPRLERLVGRLSASAEKRGNLSRPDRAA